MVRLIDISEKQNSESLFSDIRELVENKSSGIFSSNFNLVTATQDASIRDSVNLIRSILKEENITPTYYSKNGRGNFLLNVYNTSDDITIYTENMPNVTTHRMIITLSDSEIRYFDVNDKTVINKLILSPNSIVLLPVSACVTLSKSCFVIIETVVKE